MFSTMVSIHVHVCVASALTALDGWMCLCYDKLMSVRLTPHLELVVQAFDVILHSLDQLRLVLPDRTADVRPHEEGVVPGEDAEHLVGVLGRPQLVPETGRDPRLHAVNPLVIPE